MKIEEYLESLQTKELIYIFLSIPIVVFIVYYNFVYPNLIEEHNKLTKTKKEQIKKLSTLKQEIKKVKVSKKIIIPTRKKLETLKEDFKYISYSFNNIEILKLNENKIYNLFTKLLNKASVLGLNTSFSIEWDKDIIVPFNKSVDLIIKGKGNYIDIVKYVQYMEHLKALLYVKDIKIALTLEQKDKDKKKKKNLLFGFLDLNQNLDSILENKTSIQEFKINLQIVGIK